MAFEWNILFLSELLMDRLCSKICLELLRSEILLNGHWQTQKGKSVPLPSVRQQEQEMDKAWIPIKAVTKLPRVYGKIVIKKKKKFLWLLSSFWFLLAVVYWPSFVKIWGSQPGWWHVCVQVTKAWVSHHNAYSRLHTIRLSNRILLQKPLQAWKKGLSQGCWKRSIYCFCLEEPVVFKSCADDHDINSWRTQSCLYSAGKRITTFSLGISVQYVPLRTGLHVWLLK